MWIASGIRTPLCRARSTLPLLVTSRLRDHVELNAETVHDGSELRARSNLDSTLYIGTRLRQLYRINEPVVPVHPRPQRARYLKLAEPLPEPSCQFLFAHTSSSRFRSSSLCRSIRSHC